MSTLFPLLGTQLFDPAHFAEHRDAAFLLVEDRALCTTFRYHQHKLVLVLAGMRATARALEQAGLDVTHLGLEARGNGGLLAAVESRLDEGARLRRFTLPARHLARRFEALEARAGVTPELVDNPLFMTSPEVFQSHLGKSGKPYMARFYRAVRQAHDILVDDDGKPVGGKWSFDADNRRRLPKDVTPPPWPAADDDAGDIVDEVKALVAKTFADHPGAAAGFDWPVTHAGAARWLDDFLAQRFADFGPYEDAISQRSASLYHSLLSPLLNVGLLTPRQVIDRALAFAQENDVPLNSLEGFVRQIMGWREFIHGVYMQFGDEQARANFWGHDRGLAPSWYEAATGIPPLDDAIAGARERGYGHHIQRLMVLGNLMLLAGIRPRDAYRWFMEMYVDAYPWVMGPNVYGMALFSDGGLFATKPYVCGANYLLKMSDYRRGPWCDTVDGLYWRFIERHRGFFESNPRLSMMVRNLDRMDAGRRARIFDAAAGFVDEHTTA